MFFISIKKTQDVVVKETFLRIKFILNRSSALKISLVYCKLDQVFIFAYNICRFYKNGFGFGSVLDLSYRYCTQYWFICFTNSTEKHALNSSGSICCIFIVPKLV